MTSSFDTYALIISLISVLILMIKYPPMKHSKRLSTAVLILACLTLYAILDVSAFFKGGSSDYIRVMYIDLIFLISCTIFNLNLSLTRLLFISIVYNALSFLEYGTKYTFLKEGYMLINQALVISMILSVYLDGIIKNGTFRNNPKSISDNNDYSDSILLSRSPQ